MDRKLLKEWVLIGSASLSMISVAVGVVQTLVQYRQNLEQQRLLTESTRIESDLRLINTYRDLAQIAEGVSGYVVSDKAVEMFFETGTITESDMANPREVAYKLKQGAVVKLPVERTQGISATVAIGELALRYELLRPIGRQMLDNLHDSSEDARPYVEAYLEKLARGVTGHRIQRV